MWNNCIINLTHLILSALLEYLIIIESDEDFDNHRV